MKTFKELYNEVYNTTLLNTYGYQGPRKGADNHISFLYAGRGPNQQILLDLPGNEWHFMLDGNVDCVGPLDDNSLTNFLRGKKDSKIETNEEKDERHKRLAKQEILEPVGSNCGGSATPSSPGE
jgi:hypothetical protein